MLENVKQLAGFQEDVKVIKTSVDRRDISFSIRRIEHPIYTFEDLRFLVLDAAEQGRFARQPTGEQDCSTMRVYNASESLHPSQHVEQCATLSAEDLIYRIPKTIVYMESIAEIQAAEYCMVQWLIELGCSKASARQAIQGYYSLLSEFDKRAISKEFSRPDIQGSRPSRHRIILATDAMGMGINNPDIRRVVQWQIPHNMCSLLQRAGRAARGRENTGDFLWLANSWCFGPKAEDLRNVQNQPAQSSQLLEISNSDSRPLVPSTSQYQGKKAKAEAERRSKLPPGFWNLINMNCCIRRMILGFFGEDMATFQELDNVTRCCSNCSPIDILPRSPERRLSDLRTTRSAPWQVQSVKGALVEWRQRKGAVLLPNTEYTDSEFLLADRTIRAIAKVAASVVDLSVLRDVTGGKWAFFDEYGKEVLKIIQTTCTAAIPTRRGGNSMLTDLDLNIQTKSSAGHRNQRGNKTKRV
jgi:hypothetical protein